MCCTWAVLTLSALVQPGLGEETSIFGDWTIRCAAPNDCVASTQASGRTDATVYTFDMRLHRTGANDVPIAVLFQFGNARPGDGSAIILAVENGPAFRFEAESGYVRDGAAYRLRESDRSAALVDALARETALYITFINPQLRETGLAFPLEGASAVIKRLLD